MQKVDETKKSKRILSLFWKEINELEEKIQEDSLVVSDYLVKIKENKE